MQRKDDSDKMLYDPHICEKGMSLAKYVTWIMSAWLLEKD
jgi:hypothetical protein